MKAVAISFFLAATLMAQSSAAIRVRVPYEFVAGQNCLPAGDYIILASHGPNTITIRTADAKKAVMTVAHAAEGSPPPEVQGLVFNVYGDRYFLRQVWSAGVGQELSKSHAELEQIAEHRVPHTVTLAATDF